MAFYRKYRVACHPGSPANHYLEMVWQPQPTQRALIKK